MITGGDEVCILPPPTMSEKGWVYPLLSITQKKIAAEDVLLLSVPPDVGTHWSMSPTCFVPV